MKLPWTDSRADDDSYAQYADVATLIVRHTSQQLEADPDYEVATVARFAAGGSVPVEALHAEIMRWLLDDAGFTAHNQITFQRRHSNIGASGAEVVILLTLLGGIASGLTQEAVHYIGARLRERTEHLDPLPSLTNDVDGMRYAVSRAFDVRPSDLNLVEGRARPDRHAAVFEDRAGRFYGVRIESDALTIRRLQPGDW